MIASMDALSTFVDFKSTFAFCISQQMLKDARMNMGKRIESRLNTLGWKQVDLCARVPDLDPGVLNATIKRDSKGSRYAIQIAKALGVRAEWLLHGEEPMTLSEGDWHSESGASLASQDAQSLIDMIVDMDHRQSLSKGTIKAVKMLLTSIDQPRPTPDGPTYTNDTLTELEKLAAPNAHKGIKTTKN